MQSQLRLSEAILLGSTMLKPKRGFVFCHSRSGEEQGCALGMAYKAAGYIGLHGWHCPFGSPMANVLYKTAVSPCECPISRRIAVIDVIAHLFDSHVVLDGDSTPTEPAWTLEQLVDWVRTQETQVPDIQEEKQLTENTAVAV